MHFYKCIDFQNKNKKCITFSDGEGGGGEGEESTN